MYQVWCHISVGIRYYPLLEYDIFWVERGIHTIRLQVNNCGCKKQWLMFGQNFFFSFTPIYPLLNFRLSTFALSKFKAFHQMVSDKQGPFNFKPDVVWCSQIELQYA